MPIVLAKGNSFVYNGREVITTGRTASRKVRNKTVLLYEVKSIPGAFAQLDWVKGSELYTIDPDETNNIIQDNIN